MENDKERKAKHAEYMRTWHRKNPARAREIWKKNREKMMQNGME